MKINFVILRHGHGCHNAVTPLARHSMISQAAAAVFSGKSNVQTRAFKDPELSEIGVQASLHNGCVVGKTLKRLPTIVNSPDFAIDKINVLGCSPLIRSMETAYYMSRKWTNPPQKIYVFPFLREINEADGVDKYSPESSRIMETVPAYAIKSIPEQKAYLQSVGILQYFDFTFVEKATSGRNSPGDISQFVQWFVTTFVPKINVPANKLNVFAITHHGVLYDYTRHSFHNNSGIVLNVDVNGAVVTKSKYVNLHSYLPSTFFKEYSSPKYVRSEYYCPSKRCGGLCQALPSSKQHSRIKFGACSSDGDDNL